MHVNANEGLKRNMQSVESLLDAALQLRQAGELKFTILRTTTNINLQAGPVTKELVSVGLDINAVNGVLIAAMPVILAMASGDDNAIASSLQFASIQLQLDTDTLKRKIEPFIDDKLKRTHLHRTSSLSNVMTAVAGTLLTRHGKNDIEQLYPYVQLRLEYADNGLVSVNPPIQSLVLDMNVDDLTTLRDQLNLMIDTLQLMEEGSKEIG